MTPRDRRALVLGLGTVISAAMAFRIVPAAIRGAVNWRAHVEAQQQSLRREQALVASLPRLKDSLGQSLTRVVALAPRLVAVGTPAEASASLASVVSVAASRHSLRVVRMDPLPDSAAGMFTRIAVRTELEGDIRGLTGLLQVLETGDPVLTVVALTVDAPQPVTGKGVPETLHIGLTVSGYAMRKAG